MKLNLGCGMNRLSGWHNVDNSPASTPDELYDLEQTPWPWADSSADEMLFNHSLEHMGQDSKTFLSIIKEIYRVGRDGAIVRINVPHPRHDSYLHDPTHVRPITAEMLVAFDRTANEEWIRTKAANTPLGVYLGVDLAVTNATMVLEQPYRGQLQSGALKPEQISALARERNNVVVECRIELQVRKPAG